MKLKYRCLISGCDFDSETRIGLQKHYEQDHTYAERVKSSLVLSGGEYLPLTHRGHSEDVRKKLAAIMILVCGLMMITAHLSVNFAVAADEGGEGDSGGGGDSGNGGGDSGGSKDNSGGDGGQDSGDSGNGGHKQESKSNDNNNAPQEKEKDKQETNIVDEPKQQEQEESTPKYAARDENGERIKKVGNTNFIKDDGKGTPEEQEKAAIEDYINEEPGIKKPYPPIVKEPSKRTEETEQQGNDPCDYYGRNICEGSKDGKSCNDDKFDCLSDTKDGNYCTTGKCPGDDQPYDCKKSPDKCDHPKPPVNHPVDPCHNKLNKDCYSINDGPGKGGDWCKWHPDKCKDDDHDHHHHNHKHNHHNDHSNYNNHDHNYYYYYTNDYNTNNHATVILQPDYSHTNNYHDIRVVIGDDYMFDTIINFAGKPENLVITGLDISEGEQFDVCMENQNDGGQVNCVTAHLQNEDTAVYVDIRIP